MPSRLMVMTSWFCSAGGGAPAISTFGGTSTSRPICRIGVATMKMMSSTRTTSTRGVTLMSPLTSSGLPPPAPNATALSPHRGCGAGVDASLVLDEVVDELRRGIGHLDGETIDFVQEVVVEPDRRNGHEQAEGGGDERFGDTGRNGAQSAGTRQRHALERVNDAGDVAEQSDKGRGRGDRRQVAEALLHFRGGHERFALDRSLARRDHIEVVG